ncbi:glycoside hydrolase family 26 protein [Flammeovirga sp. EKP202]|uniref:glycoside hydrolase family 26 protein n=1 Tax=Flammeovirga sp. EKP202 TaxID=2770592 RepID=UPI00165FCE11|nr:glycosyl hydrolase [Flammeovirga sp. EKP202]MBD0401596.1 1,4-beta-xylanase [Flammeovirga sp. EKP202]
MRYFLFIFLLTHQLYAQERSACFGGNAKFVPSDGEKLLIVGQDLGAVGGLSNYTDGYVDAFEYYPAGVTSYTNIVNLQGLMSKANYGAGDVNAQQYIDDSNFTNSTIALGLFLVGQETAVIEGTRDYNIRRLANWIKNTNRPVYLRIGYEFDGPHNNYNPSNYVKMYQHIVDVFDEERVLNCDFVWQSDGVHAANILNAYYPGDEYVDWMAFSYFGRGAGASLISFAKQKGKPVMIAEATPMGYDLEATTENVWSIWFQPLFDLINNNESIKALAYINVDWNAQPMWRDSDINWGDSRIQTNAVVTENWKTAIDDGTWLKSTSDLFNSIGYPFSTEEDCFATITALEDEQLESKVKVYSSNAGLRIELLESIFISKLMIIEIGSGKIVEEIQMVKHSQTIDLPLDSGLYSIIMYDDKGNQIIKKVLHTKK